MGSRWVIDFSLAGVAPDEDHPSGTALYRDPSPIERWSAVSDSLLLLCGLRYAVRDVRPGVTRSGGQGRRPRAMLRGSKTKRSTASRLADFFRKALSPFLNQRHPSARAMRQACALHDAAVKKAVTAAATARAYGRAPRRGCPSSATTASGTALSSPRATASTQEAPSLRLMTPEVSGLAWSRYSGSVRRRLRLSGSHSSRSGVEATGPQVARPPLPLYPGAHRRRRPMSTRSVFLARSAVHPGKRKSR